MIARVTQSMCELCIQSGWKRARMALLSCMATLWTGCLMQFMIVSRHASCTISSLAHWYVAMCRSCKPVLWLDTEASPGKACRF